MGGVAHYQQTRAPLQWASRWSHQSFWQHTAIVFHFPATPDLNQLPRDAVDPKSGTAEFKAAAIRIDKLVGAHA